jgi:hypothetical protein
MYGPTCIFWADLTPFSLGQVAATEWRLLFSTEHHGRSFSRLVNGVRALPTMRLVFSGPP